MRREPCRHESIYVKGFLLRCRHCGHIVLSDVQLLEVLRMIRTAHLVRSFNEALALDYVIPYRIL